MNLLYVQVGTYEVRKNEKTFWKRRGVNNHRIRLACDVNGAVKEEIVQLQCLPLYSILKAMNKTTIDYLSLDVEGSEYGILDALFSNSNELKFNVASIETTYLSKPEFGSSWVEMYYLMRRNGYQLQNHIGEDDFYVHKSFQTVKDVFRP